MFAGWCYASIFNLNSSLRVILKDSLRSVPLFGWAMQIMMYIFLSRKREIDVPHIKRMFSYLLCTGATPSLLLFPEGTDLSESNKKKSNACKYEMLLVQLLLSLLLLLLLSLLSSSLLFSLLLSSFLLFSLFLFLFLLFRQFILFYLIYLLNFLYFRRSE